MPVHHIHETRPLTWGIHHISTTRPLIVDSGSSYIYNMPSHLAFPVHSILNTPLHLAIPDPHKIYLKHAPLVWRFRLFLYLKHAPSFCDSGSAYIYNTPPHLAILVQHVSMYLQRVPNTMIA